MATDWKEKAIEMRRAAVNLAEWTVRRCDGDECNHFATWERERRDVTKYSCDGCIDEMKYWDRRAESKGSGERPAWKERPDAGEIRALSKASSSISAAEDAK